MSIRTTQIILSLTAILLPVQSALAVTPYGYQTMFVGSNGHLWGSGDQYNGQTALVPDPGTSPSTAALNWENVGETAIQVQGELWVTGPLLVQRNTHASMARGTSPSIVGVVDRAAPDFVVAYQGSDNYLWFYSCQQPYDAPSCSFNSTGIPMMPGTSPSIAALTTGGTVTAFQANTGELWVIGPYGAQPTGQILQSTTSPSIAASPGLGYDVAFHHQNGFLYLLSTGNTGYGIQPNTSPSIAWLMWGAGYEVAFQEATTLHLWVRGSWATGDTGFGMMGNASPSIAALRDGGFEAAFQALTANRNLYVYGSHGAGDLGAWTAANTNPGINAVFIAPSSVTAGPPNMNPSSPYFNSVQLTWNPVDGANNYKMGITSAFGANLIDVGNVATHTVSKLYPGTTYTFYVAACYPNGICIHSNLVNKTTLGPAAPTVQVVTFLHYATPGCPSDLGANTLFHLDGPQPIELRAKFSGQLDQAGKCIYWQQFGGITPGNYQAKMTGNLAFCSVKSVYAPASGTASVVSFDVADAQHCN